LSANTHRDRESIDDGTVHRWARLTRAVNDAVVTRSLDPDHPLIQLGRFELLCMLGEGGYGIVFKARDPVLDREVAIKLCLARNKRTTMKLTREAQVLAKLKHPNIVAVYELGQHGQDVFIAMEYVAGSTMAEFVRSDPTLETIVRVYCDVGRGLAAAHERGIVHRDVKPSNILIDHEDVPRVADFGLARLHDGASATHRRRYVPSGTPAYMAPEALHGRVPDAFSDQWSFGVALWETLTKEPLFVGRRPGQIRRKLKKLAVRLAHERVPTPVLEILRRALAIDPRQRYPSMPALVADLARLLPVVSEPAPADDVIELMPVAREVPTNKPKRGVVAVGAVALVLVGAFGWAVGVGATRSESESESESLRANEPVPRPSPCARGWSNVDLDPMVVAVCELIQRDEFAEAHRVWDVEHEVRSRPNHRQHSALAEHTLIVARTFVHRAIALEQASPVGAKAAAQRALGWAYGAAALLSHGGDDIRVRIVIWRAKKFDD
jgi:serine/threonine protein kinase